MHIPLQNQLTSREQIPVNVARPSFQIHSISSFCSELLEQKHFGGKIGPKLSFSISMISE